jgi:S-adenosylmethionine:diacylglycerol 3-amino-3-carboxypropyl transferase
MTAGFEHFWRNVRFRGVSVAEKYGHRPLEEQRQWAARAFELWRRHRLVIDYDKNTLERQ